MRAAAYVRHSCCGSGGRGAGSRIPPRLHPRAVRTKQASRCQHEPVQTAYGNIPPPLFSLVQRERGRDEAIRLVTSRRGPQTREISCHALMSLIQLVLHLQSTKLAPFSHISKGYEDGWNGTVSGYVQVQQPHDKRNECLGGVHKRRLQREEKTSVYMSHLYFYFSLLTDWALGFPWAIKGGQRYRVEQQFEK